MSNKWKTSMRRRRLPHDWKKRRARILARDPICYICKKNPSTQVDHVKRGDNHDDSNLAGICEPCHRIKSAKEGNDARNRFKNKRKTQKHPGLRGGG